MGTATYSDDHVHLAFEARLDPGSPAILQHGQGTLSKYGLIKRHVVNLEARTYGGYDLRVEPLAMQYLGVELDTALIKDWLTAHTKEIQGVALSLLPTLRSGGLALLELEAALAALEMASLVARLRT